MRARTGVAGRLAWSLVFLVGGLYLSIKYIPGAIASPGIGSFVPAFLGVAMLVEGCRQLAEIRTGRR
jgi:hypothetical protein